MMSEFYVSVDVETAGPNPSQYSLLSIGACTLKDPPDTFYIELQPVNDNQTPEAAAIHGFDLETLRARAVPPDEAMRQFRDWLSRVVPAGQKPVFVALNAAFDWMFVCDYFHRYLTCNPFGHTALDIKALYMGIHRVPWQETTFENMAQRYIGESTLNHNALEDALIQARLFQHIMESIQLLPKED